MPRRKRKFRRPGQKLGAGAVETDLFFQSQHPQSRPGPDAYQPVPDLDIHGQRAAEAKRTLKRKMTEAVRRGVLTFTVNHGGGKGVLAEIVWEADQLCRECLARGAKVFSVPGQPHWARIEIDALKSDDETGTV